MPLTMCHMHHMGVMEPVMAVIQGLVLTGVLTEARGHMEVMA